MVSPVVRRAHANLCARSLRAQRAGVCVRRDTFARYGEAHRLHGARRKRVARYGAQRLDGPEARRGKSREKARCARCTADKSRTRQALTQSWNEGRDPAEEHGAGEARNERRRARKQVFSVGSGGAGRSWRGQHKCVRIKRRRAFSAREHPAAAEFGFWFGACSGANSHSAVVGTAINGVGVDGGSGRIGAASGGRV